MTTHRNPAGTRISTCFPPKTTSTLKPHGFVPNFKSIAQRQFVLRASKRGRKKHVVGTLEHWPVGTSSKTSETTSSSRSLVRPPTRFTLHHASSATEDQWIWDGGAGCAKVLLGCWDTFRFPQQQDQQLRWAGDMVHLSCFFFAGWCWFAVLKQCLWRLYSGKPRGNPHGLLEFRPLTSGGKRSACTSHISAKM